MAPCWLVHCARRRWLAIIAAAGLATACLGATNSVPDTAPNAADIGRAVAEQILLCEKNGIKAFESRLITPGGGLVNVVYRADPSGQGMKWGIGIGATAFVAGGVAVAANNGLLGEPHYGKGSEAEQSRRDTGSAQGDGNTVSVSVDQSGEGEKRSEINIFIGNFFNEKEKEAGKI
ncbi:MAG: hypothetical protein ABII82_04340 [Verrucomicrobiota bacterium]